MNANDLYEKLKSSNITLIPVDHVEASMQITCSIDEIEKYIKAVGAKYIFVDAAKLEDIGNEVDLLNEVFTAENQPIIDAFFERDIFDIANFEVIKQQTADSVGMIYLGLPVNGTIVGFHHTEEWFNCLMLLDHHIDEQKALSCFCESPKQPNMGHRNKKKQKENKGRKP